MAERTQALLGRKLKARPVISTFHAYCVRVLRTEIAALGYPPRFVIYDRGDQESAARKALRDMKVADVALRPSDLVNQISRWKTGGVRADHASSVAALSPGSTGTSRCRTTGPASRPWSTKCTVAPLTVAPSSSARC